MTATQERPAAEIGHDRRRKEDQRLITGRTRWTDNLQLPGMLHLAMVRSPFAHARITAIDTSAADGRDQRRRRAHRRRPRRRARAPASTPGRSPPTRSRPAHSPMPVDRVAFAGEIVAVVVARTAAEARDAAELVDVEYEELPAALDLKEAAEAAEKGGALAHPDLGTNKSALWVFDSAEAGTGGDVEEAIAKARTDGIVIEREYRQQRLIPAFMEPRSVVVDPTGEQITMWSATQIPHILRFALAATTGVPESKIRVIAPDVGGGFGGKLQATPGGVDRLRGRRRLGKPVKYTETRSESLMVGHHGRDQWQKLTLAAEKDGTVTGLKVELLADLGAYVAIVGGGVPVLGAFMFNAIYKFPAYHFACQTVLTNKTWTDAYRGAGRPGGDVRHRAADGRARRRGRRRPAGDPGEELDQARGVPVHHGRRAGVRLRQLRGRHRQGQGDVRVRRAARRAAAAPRRRRPGAARHRRLDVHRDVRPRAVAGARPAQLRRRRLGARERADAGHRQGRGRHRRLRARPGPRDGVQPDRRRPARRGLRGRRGAARRHPGRAQGPGHLRLALAGRRRRGAGPGGRQGDREGQADRGAPARGLGRRHRVRRRPLLGARHRPGPGDRPRSRARSSPRTTCPTASSPRWTPRRPSTR